MRDAYYYKANALKELQRNEEAFDAYIMVIELDPTMIAYI